MLNPTLEFRSLTITERETLYAALRRLANPVAQTSKALQWSAQAMLEQKMPDNFLWKIGKDE